MATVAGLVDHCLCGNPITFANDDEEPSIYCSTQCARQDALDSLSAKDPRHSTFSAPSLTSSTSFSSFSSVQSLVLNPEESKDNVDLEVDDVDVGDDEDGVWEFLTPAPVPTSPARHNLYASHYRRVQALNIPQLPSFELEDPEATAAEPMPTSPTFALLQSQTKRVPLRVLGDSTGSEDPWGRALDRSPLSPNSEESFFDRSRTPRSDLRDSAATPMPHVHADLQNSTFVSRLPVRKERSHRHSSVYDYGTVISRPPGLSLFSNFHQDASSDDDMSESELEDVLSVSILL